MTRRASAAPPETHSTRDLILDAAEHRFAEHGFAGVSMREIAAEAGLKNQASLYNHFRNKRALYEATLARGLDPILTLIAASGGAVASSATGSEDDKPGAAAALEPEILDGFLDRVLDYLEAHPHLPRLVQRAGLDDSRYLRSAVGRLLQPLYAQGIRVLGGASGPWEHAQLPQLAAGLYHLIFGYFANAALLQWVVQGDPLSPEAVAHQRRFIKTAVAQLLGVGPAHRTQTTHTKRTE
jgi:TetR/AcrR family transcriptional regulator